jgi:RNA polymerase sigma factor (TIGR02999 family)
MPPRPGPDPELNRLTEAAYGELHRVARRYFSRERQDQTLQPTALVNEVYLRLADQKRTLWLSRGHFVGIAALLMRRVLREYARGRGAGRRGGGTDRLILEDAHAVTGGDLIDFLAVDKAMNALADMDPNAAKVVELRFFGGLSIEEAAEELHISPATVKRHWTVAKAYLNRELRNPVV